MPRLSRAIGAVSAALVAGCTPVHLSHTHTVATPRPQPSEIAAVTREPVATLGVVAPAALQGFSPVLSHALVAALPRTIPPIRGIPAHDTLNALNEQGFATDYDELMTVFARSRILDRERLRRIAPALGSRYALLPGVAELSHVLVDRFDAAGFKLVRNRVVTLRLWLQLWDAQAGRILWESAGEATVATELVTVSRIVPLEEIARDLWLRMLEDNLVKEPLDRDTPRPAGAPQDGLRRSG